MAVGTGAPVGWPRDLPPPGTDEFASKVAGWLLDRGPADLRLSPIKQFPLALVRLNAHLVDGQLEATRRAYANARVELCDVLDPAQISTVQSALEAEGARLLNLQRELALVEEALRRESAPGLVNPG
ncbi:MAG: hypothetical protein WCP95_00080 [Actinomycetes bacterium]